MVALEKRRPEKWILERAARVYNSHNAAGNALGVTGQTFKRWCEDLGIETAYRRRKRLRDGG